MSKERTCFICGLHYHWCSSCHDFDPEESWKYLFHDKDCLKISRIWYAYRGNEISKEEAKREIEKFPKDLLNNIMTHTSVAAEEIQKILESDKKVTRVENNTKELVKEESVVEEQNGVESVQKKTVRKRK